MPFLGLLLSPVFFSCKHSWTQKDKDDFTGGCIHGAVKDMGEAKAASYCSCLLEKLQKRYPNPADMKYIKSDTAVYSIAKDCKK